MAKAVKVFITSRVVVKACAVLVLQPLDLKSSILRRRLILCIDLEQFSYSGSQKCYSEKKTHSVDLKTVSFIRPSRSVPQLAISTNKSKIVKAPIVIID